MNHTLRTFVAVEASAAVRRRAAELIEGLASSGAGVKWVEPGGLHLTLKFLGDVGTGDVAGVCQAVNQAAAECPAFELEIRGVGAFPSPRRPRTIWLGTTQGREALAELARRIDKALEKLGYPREGRPFQGHLTIGRVRHGGPEMAELERRLRELDHAEVGRMTVEEVVVFSSDLRPTGPVYTPLGRTALAKS
jgi:2'-5' RNA ligase